MEFLRANTRLARTDRMGVERRLDLFRVNLGSAHIDHSAAPADKIEPVAAPLHHVAGVDEAVLAPQRWRSDAEQQPIAQRSDRTQSAPSTIFI